MQKNFPLQRLIALFLVETFLVTTLGVDPVFALRPPSALSRGIASELKKAADGGRMKETPGTLLWRSAVDERRRRVGPKPPYQLGFSDEEDARLLGRHPLQIDLSGVKEAFAGKRVLITGASGFIGSNVARQLISEEIPISELILHGFTKTSVREVARELERELKKKRKQNPRMSPIKIRIYRGNLTYPDVR